MVRAAPSNTAAKKAKFAKPGTKLRGNGRSAGGSARKDLRRRVLADDTDSVESDAAEENDDGDAEANDTDKHKRELEELKKKDPEFFAFLNENDQGLLHFGEDDEEEEEGDDAEMNQALDEVEVVSEDEDELADNDYHYRGPEDLTLEMFEASKAAALKGNMRETRRLVSMFRAACQPPRDPENDGSDDEGDQQARFVIYDADIFQEVLSSSIDVLHSVFARHLGVGENLNRVTREQLASLAAHKHWRRLQPLVLSFFKLIVQLLGSIGLLPKHSQMTAFLLASLLKYLPFLSPLPRLAKATVKVLLSVWAQSGSEALENHQEVQRLRDLSFRVVMRLAQIAPGGIAEDVFRAVYLKFARRCKSVNEFNLSLVLYWTKCIVALYKSDVALAYQEAFLYVRQLALHVRSAFVKKGEAALKPLRSWQFINCLRTWTQVICASPTESRGLGMLAYPLAQTMLAVMSLLPSAYYSPLRLHLVISLQQLAAHCRLFVPTALQLCDMLQYEDLFDKPTPTTDAAPKLQVLLAFPTNSLGKSVVRDALVQQALQLLHVEAEIYRYHVGCAEYFYLPLKKLRAFSKRCKSGKWRDLVRVLVQKMNTYSQACLSERAQSEITPMGAMQFEALRPEDEEKAPTRVMKLLEPLLQPPTLSALSERPHRAEAESESEEDSEGDQPARRGGRGRGGDDDYSDDGDDSGDDRKPRKKQRVHRKARAAVPKKNTNKPKTPRVHFDEQAPSGERDVVRSFSWKDAKSF